MYVHVFIAILVKMIFLVELLLLFLALFLEIFSNNGLEVSRQPMSILDNFPEIGLSHKRHFNVFIFDLSF